MMLLKLYVIVIDQYKSLVKVNDYAIRVCT